MRLRPTSCPTPAVEPDLVQQSPAALSSLGRTTRVHPASQIRKIKDSIGKFGFREPVLVDVEGRVIAGAARVQAARELGLPTIPTVVVRDVDPESLRLLRLALIKSSEEAQWNFEILELELTDLEISLPKIDLTISGFSRVEIEGIRFGKAGRAVKDDAPPEPCADVVSSLGDLWRCGDHLAFCGDALETESYQQLLGEESADAAFLDSPYNCEISGHVTSSGRHREFVMASGEMTAEEFRSFRAANLALVQSYSRPGAVIFSFIDWRGIETEIAAARAVDLNLLNVAVWVKSPGMGSYLRSAHELCAISYKPGAAPRNNVQLGKNGRNRSNVWSYDGVGGFGAEKAKLREMHPTCKPTPLIRDALLDVTAPGEVVLDTFSGSGSTLIACEGISRSARVMDLDAGYVDVTVRRWQEFTGRKAMRSKALEIVRESYADFGPTLAAEKLAERHDLRVSKETLRKWMLEDGLWFDRQRRRKRAYQPRYRRDCVGELIQLDGCDHWWFENRGRKCTLLVFIDDATSRLMQLRFVRTESTFAYFEILRGYLEAHGRPVAFYTDKHSVFRVNKREAMKGDGLTQFGRALHSLNIELICANSSQAKGRVERAHKTLQDRLVKELRLAGVSDIDSANAFLPRFMANHNARFAKPPANPKDLHRALTGRDDLDEAFTWRTPRTVTQSLTVQYDRVVYILEQTPEALAAVGKLAEVVEYPDGRIVVRHNGVPLRYRLFDKERRVSQAAIVENKFFGPLLAHIREEQIRRDATSRPRRSIRPAAASLSR